MGYRDREVEQKLLVDGIQSMPTVDKIVREIVEKYDKMSLPIIEGCAGDTYFQPPEESRADFLRVRELDEPDSNGCTAQITLKYSDKGGNVNRVEIDLGVSDAQQAIKLLTYTLGDPLGRITKRYTVYFLENQHTTISVYKVLRDKRVFVEVEATSMKRMKEITKMIQDHSGFKLDRVTNSLFELFVKKVPMNLKQAET